MASARRVFEHLRLNLDRAVLKGLRQEPDSLMVVPTNALVQDGHVACQLEDEARAASQDQRDQIDPVLLVAVLLAMRLCPMVGD